MAGEEKPGVITLGSSKEIDPEQESRYRDQIAKARKGVSALKGTDAVGGVQKPPMPLLQRPPREQVADAMPMPGQQQSQGVQPRPPGSPLLRPETVKALEQAQKAAATTTTPEQIAQAPEKEDSSDSDKDLVKLLAAMQSHTSNVESILDNPQRREAIEARCSLMSLRDLVVYDEVKQTVPIVPDEFVVKFRSITPAESLYIKKQLSNAPVQTQQYVGELYNLYMLTAGLLELNGSAFLPHMKSNGEIDESAFEDKFKKLCRKSGYVIADLSLNYIWFDVRVRKLINPGDLKNG